MRTITTIPNTLITSLLRGRMLLLLSALSFLGACSNEQEETMQEMEAIGMSAYVAKTPNQTRANSDLLADGRIPDGQSFGVYAVYHSNSTWATDADAHTFWTGANFMNNQKVTCDALNEAYTYSPLKYWPNTPTDLLSFMAYYPYSSNSDEDINDLGVSTGWNEGLPYLHVTTKQAEAEQVDVLISDLLPDCQKQSITERVKFLFHHALSKVTFRFVAHPSIRDSIADLNVTNIQITNIYNDGDITPSYNTSTEETTLTCSGFSSSHKADYTFQPNEFQLLLPQTLRADAELTLSVELTLKSGDTVFTYDADGKPVETSTYTYRRTATIALNTLCIATTSTPLTEWLPNHHYIYTIRIGAKAIEFTGQVVDWGDTVPIEGIELEEK